MTTNRTPQAPDSCTLPAAEQPGRLAEVTALFSTALRAQQRPGRTHLRWTLDPAAEAVARDLVARESTCCTFFRFTVTPGADGLTVDVRVPDGEAAVLDAFVAIAAGATP